tara:strand:- start:5496 stop:7742 length:2247 start_codon:yes stop_codon:yes gene_type:complete
MPNLKVTIFFLILSTVVGLSDESQIELIEIEGNQRIDKETIVSYSNIAVGEYYTNKLGNNVLKELFETNLFSNIEVSFEDNILSIRVEENPTINLVKFIGNKKVKDEDLLLEIELKERSVYSRSLVKKDIDRMLSLYQKAGRLSSEINPKVEILDNNRINLTYEISESDVSKVSKIVFIGNETFSSSRLKSIMKTKEKRFLRFFSSSDKYDPDKIEYDKQLITQFYNDNGFPNINFNSDIAQLIESTNNFEIIFYITEGEQYNFGDIEIISELKKIDTQKTLEIIPFSKGQIFNRSKISDSIDAIKELAEVSGYSFIEIDTSFSENAKEKTIDITLNINEGPRVYIDEIGILGNTRTLDKVIRREISLSEGDAYNKYTINYSKDAIRSLNFFSEVNIEEQRTSFPDRINLSIEVEEKNTGEATLGAGYSSATSTSLNLGLKENNFLGRGQKVNFGASYSDTRTTYDIRFTEPYYNNKQLSLSTQLYSNFSDPASVNYETEDIGFGLTVGFPIAPDKSILTEYSLFTAKTTADSNATVYEKLLAGTDTISQVGIKYLLDRRNSRYKPSRGYNFSLDQSLAGLGGTSYFYKNNVEFNSYRRLSKQFIGAFKIDAGMVKGYNGKYAPLSSNYTLGGKKLRGFKSGKIGPKSGTSYTGGQYYYVTSIETNIDFNLDAYDITSTLFLDVGSVWGLENPGFASIEDKHLVRSSVGVNFNWDSAIGPINIIYANIIDSEKTDTTDNIYFDIGYNF